MKEKVALELARSLHWQTNNFLSLPVMLNPALYLQYMNILFSAELKYRGIFAFNLLNVKYFFDSFFSNSLLHTLSCELRP